MNDKIYMAFNIFLRLIEIAILVRAFMSWLPIPKNGQLVKLILMLTEPILAPIRKMLQKSEFTKNLMFDFSPIAALIILALVRSILAGIL